MKGTLMIDLLSIAKTESAGGDLLSEISALFEPADIKPDGYPNSVVWKEVEPDYWNNYFQICFK